jgi:MFS family permease
MFIAEMFVFIVFLVALTISPTFWWLIACLFGLGLALGCDYPTAHMIISESIPSSMRGRLVLAAFGFQSVGILAGTMVGYVVLKNLPEIGAWRWMYAVAIVPAILVAWFRFGVTESAPWLLHRGRKGEAGAALLRLLHRIPLHPRAIQLLSPESPKGGTGYAALFSRRNIRATILASVPWFLQDLGTYGIGIFTPTILAATLGHRNPIAHNVASLVGNDILATKGAALIDVLLLVGVAAAVLLTDRAGRIRLQIIGFIGCAAGLAIAAFSTFGGGIASLFVGFMLFDFMTNMGPNAQSYLIAGEVFPTHIRARGAGFAAAFAKSGAVLTAFLFPILLKGVGEQRLLAILVGTSLLGAAVTWFFRIETRGKSLEAMA